MDPDTKSRKERFDAFHRDLCASYRERPEPSSFLKKLSKRHDEELTAIWQELGIPATHALVAVGGYGRGELFPFSDADILILLSAAPDEETAGKIESFVAKAWAVGIAVGHSVRTVNETITQAGLDTTVLTGLLDMRFVTGSRSLFNSLKKALAPTIDPKAFYRDKLFETRGRHLKHGDTPYSLEPNCKESPGGLRDLQEILWITKAAGLGRTWNELSKNALLTADEARQLTRREKAFKDIRIRLHITAGRAEDRLLFDLQMPLAETFSFKKNGTVLESRKASEELMKRYFLAAHTVTQLNRIVLQNVSSRLFGGNAVPVRINDRFFNTNGLIDIAKDDVFVKHPSAMLEVFYLLTDRTSLKDMTPRTQRALWHARIGIGDKFRNDPTNHSYFLIILKSKRFASQALAHMNELGILGRYLPVFGKIIGQMQHDLFHQYTVDQHTLNVISNLHRFSLSEYAHENPLCSRLMTGFERPWVLTVAALFHDIAKGRGGDHSELGAVDAEAFCELHRINPKDSRLIVFLVREHITMSDFAQKRDFTNPDVLHEFASRIKDRRTLTALYLLTVADIRGTNETIWNTWKSKLLEDLFSMTLRILEGEDISADNEFQKKQKEALAKLQVAGLGPDIHTSFWKCLDVVYFLRHDASDIAWQTEILHDKITTRSPVVKCRIAPIGGGIQVTVYMKDEKDLFTRICAYFEREQFSILDAKIHTTGHGYALDTFLITCPDFENDASDLIRTIEPGLKAVLESPGAPPEPATPRLSRKSRIFPLTPTVDLRADASGRLYVLSVTANDRRGLLYSISRVFGQYGVNLHTAKIMTLGERIEDVFLIGADTLANARTRLMFERDLFEVLKVKP